MARAVISNAANITFPTTLPMVAELQNHSAAEFTAVPSSNGIVCLRLATESLRRLYIDTHITLAYLQEQFERHVWTFIRHYF